MADGFGFAPPDYLLRAQAGMPVDPSNGNGVMPPPTPQAAPQPPQGGQGQGYTPGLLDILQGVVFNGQSPAEAAMAARQRNYQAQTMQVMANALRNAPDDATRLAMLLNPGELGKALASQKTLTPLKGGETALNAPGGGTFTAPLLSFDDKSGRGVSVGAGGTLSSGGAQLPAGVGLGGDFSAKDGTIYSGRDGGIANTYSLPQMVPSSSSGVPFTPTVTGPGAPAPQVSQPPQISRPASVHTAIAPSAVLNAQGQLDPISFFRSFIGPHEGGWNARDLNGSPTKYGINQAANPGVDVSKITPDDAASIFTSKYFPTSAALPPALAAVNADTAFINPTKAANFLAQSGGDPSKYMDLREAWMNGMVQKNPAAAKYAEAWTNRNADLRALATKLGGASPDSPQQPAAPALGGGFGAPFAQGKMPAILDRSDQANAAAYKGQPPGTVLQRAADGTVSPMAGTAVPYDQRVQAKLALEKSDDVADYRKANTAWQAMLQAASQPQGGMRAYAMRDTFARLINPGAVARVGTIQALKESQGVPENIRAYLLNLQGDGDVPPATVQQILDVANGFMQSHYATAKSLVSSFATQAQRNGIDSREVTPDLPALPPAKFISGPVPPAQQRKPAIYATPKGPMQWTGTGWVQPQ